ncbi:MAG: energy-coupling factor transporter transmembrane protein EcfT [Coriobacteriales bacterium]|jgi:energy-coupling factor transport system permease protein|nr:energy-coupling factor transporter transmembrane protein EcfT [Coriobacteriales bacterium]
MAFDSIIGQYYYRDSLIHALDPRLKLSLLLFFIALAFVADSFLALFILLALLGWTVGLSRIPLPAVVKALLPTLALLLFPLLFNLFFVQSGTILTQLGGIAITDEGLYRGTYMSLRLLFLFSCATLVTLTTTTIAISDACAAMLRPFRRLGVPDIEIALLVSIALRFIPTLADAYSDILKAQQARGAIFDKGGPIARLRGLLPLLVPLFAQAFRHGEDLAVAMESRCYHGGERSHYRELRMRKADYGALAVVGAVALLIGALRLFHSF